MTAWVSTKAPRDVLSSTTPFFILPMPSWLIKWRVCGVSGKWRERMSEACVSVAR